MKSCLVTGGAGFIGSHLTHALLERGCAVRVLDNLSTGHLDNLSGVLDRIEWVEGDVTDLATVRRAVAGVDVVFHEAALASVTRSVEDPIATHETCATGTLNVLVAAKDAGVRRVVYASSSSVYGDTPTLPKVETMVPSPMSPYAAAKLAGEGYMSAFTKVYGLECVSLRYFNVFGPRQDPKSPYSAVIPLFATAMIAGHAPTIFGDGEQSRDFSHVENVIHANILATQSPNAPGHVLNVACGARQTLNQLVETLNELLGTQIEPRYADPRPGDVLHSHADISLAREVLGYEPRVDFREGLRRTVEWYREQLSTGTQ